MEILGSRSSPRVMSAPSMVDKYLRSRGIKDERVLAAMSKIPRPSFVPEAFRERAYSDHPLPIGHDQTISQPYIVALMSQTLELKGTEKVLEVGTGSGYQTAVLAELAKSVFSVERIHALASAARKRLEEMEYHNVSIRVANGSFGWSEFAPYDGILVTAAVDEFPQDLIGQLTEGGRLIIPVAETEATQKLYCFKKSQNKIVKKFLAACSFVPLVS